MGADHYHDHMCYLPAGIAEKLTYGRVQVDGFEPECVHCVVLWGSNPATSHNPYQWNAVLDRPAAGGC
jgi:anaerobic selenocysteine-containing dehydrogenase